MFTTFTPENWCWYVLQPCGFTMFSSIRGPRYQYIPGNTVVVAAAAAVVCVIVVVVCILVDKVKWQSPIQDSVCVPLMRHSFDMSIITITLWQVRFLVLVPVAPQDAVHGPQDCHGSTSVFIARRSATLKNTKFIKRHVILCQPA